MNSDEDDELKVAVSLLKPVTKNHLYVKNRGAAVFLAPRKDWPVDKTALRLFRISLLDSQPRPPMTDDRGPLTMALGHSGTLGFTLFRAHASILFITEHKTVYN